MTPIRIFFNLVQEFLIRGNCQIKKPLSIAGKFIYTILGVFCILITFGCLKFPIPPKTAIGTDDFPIEELSRRTGKPLDEIRSLEFHSSDFGDSDLEKLPGLPSLEFLSLGGTGVKNLATLSSDKFPKLATIYLEDTKVTDDSFHNWDNPPLRITKLFLNRTKITNLNWSYKFPKLRRLNIEQTDVKNLEPLKANPDLIHIWMGRTQIRDLSPIRELKNLEYIGIDNLWISKENIRKFKERRPYTKIVQYTEIHF
jgi:hypothetical protein